MISIYEQNEKRLNEIMDKQYEKLEVLAKISERLEKLENED